jgi:hypothetical protein
MIAWFESDCNSIGKIIHENLHIITQLVFFILFISSRIFSVYIDELFLFVYTDSFNEEKSYVGKYHCKISMKKEQSIISFVFIKFMVVAYCRAWQSTH